MQHSHNLSKCDMVTNPCILQVDRILAALSKDMLKHIRATGENKACFYMPPAMEAIAGIWAAHFTRSDSIQLRAKLAGTELRDSLDNTIGEDLVMSEYRLHVTLKRVKSAVNAFVHQVLKAAAPRPIHPIGQLGPAFPSQEPKVPQGYYPPHIMQYGHHRAAPSSGPAELCRGFAKGTCKFGNTCRYVHELGMAPPRARTQHASAQQK